MIDERRNKATETPADPDLESVKAAWRDLPRDEPPELVDRAVLNRARRDLEKPPPRRLRWVGHFATAGIVVIAVSLWLLQDGGEPPAPGDGTLRLERAADEPAPPASLRDRRTAPAEALPQAAAPSVMREKSAVARQESLDTAAAEAESPAEDEASGAAGLRDPDAWIEELLRLRAEGRDDELDAGLKAFREAWPDYPLPPALRVD